MEEFELVKKYLEESAKDASVCTKFIENITDRIKSGNLNFSNGNPFLDVRNRLLLEYLINLQLLFEVKLEGKSVQESPFVDRLACLRVYIEKGQNIYSKMHYQIDKVLALSRNSSNIDNNPLLLKPRLDNLTAVDNLESADDEEDDEQEDKSKKIKAKIYRPPKIAPVRFDEDNDLEDAKRKSLEKAKKKALSSSIMEELRREYDEGPQEISLGSIRQRRAQKKLDEIRRYEEDNFTRVTLSKKDKQAMKRSMTNLSTLTDDLTNFGDTSFLNDGNVPNSSTSKRSSVKKYKKKYKSSSKGGKKIKKRRIQ